MTRIGYKYQAVPSAANGITALQAFLQANLQTWGVSPVYNKDSGGNERNYLVLSHGTREILLYVPNGNSYNTRLNQGILSGWYKTGMQVQEWDYKPFALGYSPSGGYQTGFSNGLDPKTHAAFWQGTSSSHMSNVLMWKSDENRQLDIYFIENTARAELIVYCGRPDQGFGFWVCSSALFSYTYAPTPNPSLGYTTDGMYRVDVSQLGATQPRGGANPLFTRWRENNMLREAYSEHPLTQSITWVNDTMQPNPTTGLYDTALMPGKAYNVGDFFNGHVNPDLFREYPAIYKTGGRVLRGMGPNDYFVHALGWILSPWCPNLPSPFGK